MIFLLNNCSKNTVDFIKTHYNTKDCEVRELKTLNNLEDKLIDYKEDHLLIVEIENLDINALIEFKNKEFNLTILVLFDEKSIDLAVSLVNSNIVEFIYSLPLDLDKFKENVLDKASIIFQNNIKNNIKLNNNFEKDDKYKDMLVMKYIYDLIYGNVSDIENINNITSLLNFSKVPNFVFIVMVDDFWDICIDFDNKQRYYLKSSILQLVKKSIRNYEAITCSLVGTDKIVVLLDVSGNKVNMNNYLLEITNYIKEYIRNNSSYTVTLGLGNIHNDYRDLWKGYEESFLAINYSFYQGKDLIIKYKDIEKLNNNKMINYNFLHFKYQIFKNLARGDIQIILNLYEALFNLFILGKYQLDSIRTIISKFLFDILEFYIELGFKDNEMEVITIETSAKILRASSITTIKEISKNFIEEISKQIAEITRDNVKMSLEASVIFINNYYYEPLTLRDVSDVANMSEHYFSRKFKEQYGINFINYLLNLRLEKAYRLLEDTNLSIRDISQKVGFNDLSYFSRSFKKIYNFSPSYFKKKL